MNISFFFRTFMCICYMLLCMCPYIAKAQKRADYNTALKLTLAKEGGYVNSRDLHGGETYCGITRKTHPDWKGWHVIDKQHPKRDAILPELNQSVSAFYRTEYWDRIRAGEISDQKKANKFFDRAVRKGVERAIMHEESHHGMKKTGIASDELIAMINKHR